MRSTVKIVFEDAPTPGLSGAIRYGTITHVFDARLLGRKVARVVLSAPVRVAGREVGTITVVPRHRRYGFRMAAWVPIAVHATDLGDLPDQAEREEGQYGSRTFAIATLRRLWWRRSAVQAG